MRSSGLLMQSAPSAFPPDPEPPLPEPPDAEFPPLAVAPPLALAPPEPTLPAMLPGSGEEFDEAEQAMNRAESDRTSHFVFIFDLYETTKPTPLSKNKKKKSSVVGISG